MNPYSVLLRQSCYSSGLFFPVCAYRRVDRLFIQFIAHECVLWRVYHPMGTVGDGWKYRGAKSVRAFSLVL